MLKEFFSKLTSLTGPGTAIQEVLYGFIMALTFAYAVRFGLLHFDSKVSFMITVTGMDLTWGVIDGIIFFYIWALDIRRHTRVISNADGMDRESRVQELMDSFSGTPLDAVNDEEKRKVCESLLDKPVQSREEFKADRKAMFLNSVGCVFFSNVALIPVLGPLFFIDDFVYALEIACWISAIGLFIVGYYMAPYVGLRRITTGAVLAGISLIISVAAVFTGG